MFSLRGVACRDVFGDRGTQAQRVPQVSEARRLAAWYAAEWQDEASGIIRLHEGVGIDGAPAWSSAFEQFILTNPWVTYSDNPRYRKPMRAALARVAERNPHHFRYLTLLRASWDARDTPGELAALRHLRRQYREFVPARFI